MLFIRSAKRITFIATAILMFAVIVLISMNLTEVIAAERITDGELETLYGGWGFYNPYCTLTSNDCDEHTECNGFDKCRFCIFRMGWECTDNWSIIPDFDGCDDGTSPCENAPWVPRPDIPEVYGFCSMMVCVPEFEETGFTYPDCGDTDDYDWCDD